MSNFHGIQEGYSEDDITENYTFHYNREERIKNAPKIVQDYYDGKLTPQKGFFKILVANKMNRLMLVVVAVCCLVVLFVNKFTTANGALKVCGGFECEMSAFSYDDSVYAQIKIHALKKSLADKKFTLDEYIKDGKEAAAVFSFVNTDGEVFSKIPQTVFLAKKEFFLRTSSPDYDIMEVLAQVEILGERVELKAKVKKRG